MTEILSKQIEDKLYKIISSGEFPPGSQLPGENELSARFGVSRSTLREAIRSLSAAGVLTVRRGKGTFVSENFKPGMPDVAEFNLRKSRVSDLFEARLIFEPDTAALACRRASDEEIEEIPVKDLALFVGQNTHYFLPKFKDMATKGKKVSWNWAAFLFDCFYLFYRKMWGPAIVTAVLKLALSVPSLVLFYNMFFLQMGLDMPSGEGTLTLMYQLSNIFYILSLVMRAAISLFTNYLYQRQVFYSVGKLRDRKDSPEYSTLLTAKGGTSVKAVVLCIVATLLFSFLSSIMLLASISSLY